MRSGSIPATGRFSPLRYPGGKGKLAKFVANIIKLNDICDGSYVEPYAGGAGVAWELLQTGVVRTVHINDKDRSVYLFWDAVLNNTEALVRLIRDTPVDVDTRDKLKHVIMNQGQYDDITVGFSLFFLNRTNRSGIINGGIIGGRAQTGKWKIDARYNKEDLINKIERIAAGRRRVFLSNMDAIEFINKFSKEWRGKTLVYLDPPYYEKGRDLYYSFYKHDDHGDVSAVVRSLVGLKWIVSYDDVPAIHDFYSGAANLRYTIGYSARARASGREAMFFSAGLKIPKMIGSAAERSRHEVGECLSAG